MFYVLPCVILFLCFSVLLAFLLPRLGKRELILVLYVHLFDLRMFDFVWPSLGVLEKLRFSILALPGLFRYLFRLQIKIVKSTRSEIQDGRHLKKNIFRFFSSIENAISLKTC